MHRFLAALWALAFCSPLPAEEITLRVMTFNVWYGGEQVSLEKVAQAIRAADADIAGLQETDGNLERIAQAAGMPYVDPRRRIVSRWPIFDSGSGERTQKGPSQYSTTALDLDALHAWVMVRPGQVVAVANVHLSSDPSGLEAARLNYGLAGVLGAEEGRVKETQALTALGRLAADGTPVFLTGDFNTPSHLDWTEGAKRAGRIPYVVPWPVTHLLADAGLRDSFREANPDPLSRPGITWTPGAPHPLPYDAPGRERIDMIFAAGRAKAVASQVVGEDGGPDVEIAVTPWPSDHRAVVSTFRVQPKNAAALISVTPRRVPAGGTFLVRVWEPAAARWNAHIVPRGGDARDALMSVKELQNSWQRAVRMPAHRLPPGNYDALLTASDGRERKRAAFTVTAPDAKPGIEAVKAQLRIGEPIRVRWRNAPGDLRDWIGIYRAGETGLMQYLGFVYTEALFDGEAVVEAMEPLSPLTEGEYELRLLHDETYVELANARFTIVR